MHCCSVFRLKVMVPTSEARRQLLGWCFAEADVRRTTIRRILGQIKPTFLKSFWGVEILVIERLKADEFSLHRLVRFNEASRLSLFLNEPEKGRENVKYVFLLFDASLVPRSWRKKCVSCSSALHLFDSTLTAFLLLSRKFSPIQVSSDYWLVGAMARRKRSRFSPSIPGFESRSRHSRFFWQWPIERCVREENH